jgi:hypothetical protein
VFNDTQFDITGLDAEVLPADVLDVATAEALKGARLIPNDESFRDQIRSNGDVHIGISNMAWHLMSRIPTMSLVHPFVDKIEDLPRWDTQAKREWCQILTHRSNELALGGRLLVSLYVRDEEDRPFPQYNPLSKDLKNDFPAQYVLLQLLAEGILTEEEVRACCRPTHQLRISQLVSQTILTPIKLKLLRPPWMSVYRPSSKNEVTTRVAQLRGVLKHVDTDIMDGKLKVYMERLTTIFSTREHDDGRYVAYLLFQKVHEDEFDMPTSGM